jgi:hypothetical protein
MKTGSSVEADEAPTARQQSPWRIALFGVGLNATATSGARSDDRCVQELGAEMA